MFAGAENATAMSPLPAVTAGAAGRPGTAFGTTAADDGDDGPAPFPFVALTLHVYVLPLVNPATAIGDEAPVTLALATPPFDDTHFAVYPVITEPPSDGGTNDTTICPEPATTVGAAGAAGSEPSTTESDGTEAGPSPLTFDANTVHVYVLPVVKPDTAIGDDAPGAVPGAPPSDDTQLAV